MSGGTDRCVLGGGVAGLGIFDVFDRSQHLGVDLGVGLIYYFSKKFIFKVVLNLLTIGDSDA